MHYVYLTNTIVTDQAQVDPFSIFSAPYAAQFIEAPDEVTFGWSFVNGEWIAPAGPTPEEIQAQNKQQASALLYQTDWTTIADVADPINSPYLANQAEFITYRNLVRNTAVYPPTTPVVFPAVPTEVWGS